MSALKNGHPERSGVAEHAMNTGHTINHAEEHSNKGCHASILAEIHPGDLALEESAPPHQPRRRHPTSRV